MHQDLGLNSRLQTVVFQASKEKKEHLAAMLIWSHFHWSVLETQEGRAVVEVSAVWLREPSSNCASACFLDQGDFVTYSYGAGDRLHQPACLLSWHYRCVLCNYHYLFDNASLSAYFVPMMPKNSFCKGLCFGMWTCQRIWPLSKWCFQNVIIPPRGPSICLVGLVSCLTAHFLIKVGFWECVHSSCRKVHIVWPLPWIKKQQ